MARSRRRRIWLVALVSTGVVIVGAVVAVVAIAKVEYPDGPEPVSLLASEATWSREPANVDAEDERTFDDPLEGEMTKIGEWMIADTGIEARQEVTITPNPIAARLRYTSADPMDAFRGDFSSVRELAVDLPGSDQAKMICIVGKRGNCYVIEYWLRYGRYLVSLSFVADADGVPEDLTRKMAITLDGFIPAQLR